MAEQKRSISTNRAAIKKLFRRMLKAAEEYEEEETLKILEEARASGWILHLETVPGEPHPEPDGLTSSVDQHCVLTLGPEVVAKWKASYAGYYGGMGAGWWIEEYDNTRPSGISELLETAEIEEETPDLPAPEAPEDDDPEE